jgi:hypothetical protein
MVGFEPTISSTQNWRITKLSYIPMHSNRWVPFGTHPGISRPLGENLQNQDGLLSKMMSRDKDCKDSKPYGPHRVSFRHSRVSPEGGFEASRSFEQWISNCSLHFILGLVHQRGLEPPRVLPHLHLKQARLPVTPLMHDQNIN